MLFTVSGVYAQTIQLANVSQDVFCSTGKDTMRFSVNYSNVPANSNIVFYQSTNPNFNPYNGEGDSIGFINIGGNTSNGNQIITPCPRILGIFIDACNDNGRSEPANEYILMTSGSGFQVSNLKIDLPANRDINMGSNPCAFGTPNATLMNLLRIGTCNSSNLLAAGPNDSIPPNALVVFFTGNGTDQPYDFSDLCNTGQKIYILQNACTLSPTSGSFANNGPAQPCSPSYRETIIYNRSCVDRLAYDRCGLPVFDNANPNAGDGNYVIHLDNTDTSSVSNGGILNNAANKCNGVELDSIVGTQIISYPIPNDGAPNPVTNFCNTGYHYINAIIHPNGTKPVSNTIQFKLVCLDVNANVAANTICSGQNANIQISSGDPNAVFSWVATAGSGVSGASNGSGSQINQALTNTGSAKDSVTYSVIATDGGCSANKSVKVYVNPPAGTINLGNDTAVCAPVSVPLSTGNPATVWTRDGGPMTTAASITATQPGTYVATISTSCGNISDTKIISLQSPPAAFSLGNDTAVCLPISLLLSTGDPNTVWSKDGAPLTTGASVTATAAGTYRATVTNSCGSAGDEIVISQTTTGTPFSLGNDTAYCGNIFRVLSTGNATTQWTRNGAALPTGASITVTTPGTYKATITNNCGTVSDEIILSQNPLPTPFSLGNDTTYCGNIFRVLSTGDATTQWTRNGAALPTGASVNVTTPGTYKATITNSCGTVSDEIVISQSSGLNFSFGSPSTSVCKGGSITLDAGGGFSTYQWNTGASSSSIIVTTAGKYWVTVTQNGCSGSDTINVSEINSPAAFSLGRDSTFCGNFSWTLSVGNAQAVWTRNGAQVDIGATYTITQAGTYKATVTNSCGTVSDEVIVSTVNSTPVNLGRDTTLCAGNSLQLNATLPGNNTYLWSTGQQTSAITVSQQGTYWVNVSNGACVVSDTINIATATPLAPFTLGNDTSYCGAFTRVLATGVASTVWSTGEVAAQIAVSAPGPYKATITNACGTQQDEIRIQQFALPLVAIGRDTTFCDSITLSVGNGSFVSVLWNTGATTPSITVNAAGQYSVVVENANCANGDTILLTADCAYEVYMPSAFSPNNDGLNDVLVPLSDVKDIVILNFVVFNRWGEKVYEATNFLPKDQRAGWDGSFKGDKCEVDQYVYVFTAKMPDDTVKTYKGSVTLLK